MSEYSELFKDVRWQKLRLKVLERDGWACKICDDKESTLHVHHRYYLQDKKPWEYHIDALVTLCEDCHKYETSERASSEKILIDAFKTKFLSDNLWRFIDAIIDMPMLFNEKVIAAAYGWAMKDPEMQKEIVVKFNKHLDKIIDKKVKDGMA